MPGALDDLVTAAAAQLMAATAGNAAALSQRALADLVSHFGVDFGVLRHNDHTIRATVLVAEWPPRPDVPDPDPLAVIYFADADSVFAQLEHLKEATLLRPEPTNADYQNTIEGATGVPAISLAGVPLLSGDVTTGSLGFGKFGDRDWQPEELNALQTIGTLFAQLQARIVAEEQVRYLAEHDDLTDLLNRRALIAHLDGRLAEVSRDRSRYCSSTWTASRSSMSTSARTPATSSSRASASSCARLRAHRQSPPGSVATSLSSCRPNRWTSTAPSRLLIGCKTKFISRSRSTAR